MNSIKSKIQSFKKVYLTNKPYSFHSILGHDSDVFESVIILSINN